MTDLTKDEIVSAVAQKAGCAWLYEPLAQRFAALCRAPLVAENEGLKESLESVLSQLKERDAELARVRAGEPFGWYSAKEDDFMLDKIRKTHERLNSHTHRIGKYDLALYTTPPQPAAQQRESCTWTEQDDKDMPGTYESSCGEMWSFIDGGVKENRVTYCHHCGGKVVPASPQEQT